MNLMTKTFGAAALTALTACTPATTVQNTERPDGSFGRGQIDGPLTCSVRSTGSAPTTGRNSGVSTGRVDYDCRNQTPAEQARRTTQTVKEITTAIATTTAAVILVDNLIDRLNFAEVDENIVITNPEAFLEFADRVSALTPDEIDTLIASDDYVTESFMQDYIAHVSGIAEGIRAAENKFELN